MLWRDVCRDRSIALEIKLEQAEGDEPGKEDVESLEGVGGQPPGEGGCEEQKGAHVSAEDDSERDRVIPHHPAPVRCILFACTF